MLRKINKVFKHHKLGRVDKAVKLKGGRVNPVYIVNSKYVIKFDALKRGFDKENYVLNRFKNMPLAKVMAYDASRKVVPEEYIVQTKLQGKNLSFIWPSLKESEREKIFKNLIKILKKFHKKNYGFYGDFQLKKKQQTKWSDFYARHFKKAIGLAQETKLIDKELFGLIKSFYNLNQKFLDQPKIKACFCHNDLHFANILVEKGKITGILDFDLSLAAPIDFEFEILTCFLKQPDFFVADELKKKYTKPLSSCYRWLRENYKELYEIPNIKERMSLYSIAGDMEMLWLCDKFGYGQRVKNVILTRLEETLQGNYWL